MDEAIVDFLVRSQKRLEVAHRSVNRLQGERNRHPSGPPASSDQMLLGELDATFHSIKGTSGFLGFARLITLARAGERLAEALLEQTVQVNQETVTLLSVLIDRLGLIVARLLATGREYSAHKGENNDEREEDFELAAELDALRRSNTGFGENVAAKSGTGSEIRIERVSSSDIKYLGTTPVLLFEGSLLPVEGAVKMLKSFDSTGSRYASNASPQDAELVVLIDADGSRRAAVTVGQRLFEASPDAQQPSLNV